MAVRHLSVLAIALVLTLGHTRAQNNATENVVANASGSVQIKNCVKVLVGPDRPGFSVTYGYKFPGLKTVEVEGLGEVPASGEFHYFTEEKQLGFRQVPSGKILLQVPLVATIVPAGNAPLNEVPGESEFQNAFRSFVWDSPESLQVHANQVLGRHFHYLPGEEGKVMSLSTTFAPLRVPGARNGVLAQIALRLSFPYDPQSGKYAFHIQTIVKEGRALSDDYRTTTDPTILRSGDDFVDGLVKEMAGHP